MIRAVIFDLGHTLWDILPDTTGALDRAYANLREQMCVSLHRDDVPDAHAIRRAVGDVLKAMADEYYNDRRMDEPEPHTYLGAGCRELGLELDEALLRDLCPPIFATEIDRLHCADGTLDAVQALHDAGYALGCITNTITSASTIRSMLQRHALEGLMRTVVVSSEEGWRKPHPSLFEKALRELNVAPREAVFVGDSPWHDIEGAREVGMRAVLTRQYATRPTEGFMPPDAVIDHLRELRDVISRLDSDERMSAAPRSN
jgi:HAD superfamily hydrolase (TIGR01662 family)